MIEKARPEGEHRWARRSVGWLLPMGQESSRVVDKARAAASKFARDFGPETDSASSILWEGVSDEMRWLVIAQVREPCRSMLLSFTGPHHRAQGLSAGERIVG